MFAGIVKGVGRIIAVEERGGDRHVRISYTGVAMEKPELGASIAVNGICLTVTAATADHFETDVSAETLAVTAFGGYVPGTGVNLEGSLRVGDPIDGHLVSGHVDGVGRVLSIAPAARSVAVTVGFASELARFIALKGSVTVDGVSLTVNRVDDRSFEVNVVPHTRSLTIFGDYRPGSLVNLEIDTLARYVERMLCLSPVVASDNKAQD